MKDTFCKGHIKAPNLPSGFNGSGTLEVEIANRSEHDWKSEVKSDGQPPVNICYHWLDENWNMISFEGFRTALPPEGLAAGKTGKFTAQINPPEKHGTYHLAFTLVRERKYWFDGAKDFYGEIIEVQVGREPVPDHRQEGANAGPAKVTGPNLPPDDSQKVPPTRGLAEQAGLVLGQGGDFVNIKPFDSARKIGYMHIPKSSGSAMISLLVKALDIKTYFSEADRNQKLPQPVNFPIGEHYLAHVPLDVLLKYCPDGQYLTVFREASSRCLSNWLFWRHAGSLLDDEALKKKRYLLLARGKLIDVLRDPVIAGSFDNLSLRMLVGPDKRMPNHGFIDPKDDEELLQAALERLKKFSFLDVVENPQFESNLQKWLGTENRYQRENETQIMPKHLQSPLQDEFTREAIEALEKCTRLDRVLWATVAAARMPGVDLARLTRETLIKNIARYSAIMS